jgi:START domain
MPTRRTRRLASLTTLALLALAKPAASDPSTDGWKPGDKGQGKGYAYQVFTQQKEGEPFVRYQVRGTIDADPELLATTAQRLSTDPSRAPKDQTRKVISNTDTETVLHTSIDLPMMFSDRDIVTRGVRSTDSKTGIRRIDFKSIEHPAVPPQEGFLRLKNTGGFWEFVPDGAKHSKVTFETYVDLGGSLPSWLVSGMMGSTAIGNYEDLAKETVGKQ